jgi:Fe-S oxidoreductase
MRQSAELSGSEPLMSYPSLHSSCCGALGGMFRGETTGTKRLVEFAAAAGAPIVTTCLLCRDNVRSAARRSGRAVDVHFWPEFFSAAPAPGTAAGERTPVPATEPTGDSHV